MFLFGNLIMLNYQKPNLSSFVNCRSILLIVLFLQMVQLDFDFVSLRNGSNQASRKGGIDRREMFRIFQISDLGSRFLAFTEPSLTFVWIPTCIGEQLFAFTLVASPISGLA